MSPKLRKAQHQVAQTGLVDLIDVEATGDEIVKRSLPAHMQQCQASNHDLGKTPDKDDIVGRLRKMQELGAISPKIAVML